ncbi:MAG: lysophospholipid acyltransferase family protein [Pseudomonadota bacterium]|nr:lysophospholipid acyltransferase family protein [Pseudomonadota bacterium]
MLKMGVNALLLLLLFVCMTLLLVVVNVLLLLNLLCVAPFSAHRSRAWAAEIATGWLRVGKFYMEHVLKISYRSHVDAKVQERLQAVQKGILIANHQSMIDILVMNQLAAQFSRQQELTWLAKNTFKYVPLLGWGAYLTGSNVYLKRDWDRDKSKLRESFDQLLVSERPFWLLFCPEGTRLTAKRLAASQAFNRRQQRPPFKRILSPRAKGFIAAVTALRPVVSAVIDVTICYSHRPPLFAHILRGERITIDVHVKVLPIDSLPTDTEGLRDWLFDLFKAKDQLLSASSP